MKKFIAFFLVMVTAVSVSACTITLRPVLSSGNSSSGSSKTPSYSGNQGKTNNQTKTVTVSNQIIYDDGTFTVTATDFVSNGTWGPGLKMLIENNSDKSIMVMADDVSVNGYIVGNSFTAQVAPGKKTYSTMEMLEYDLSRAKITTIADIEFRLSFMDTDPYRIITETEPLSVKTSAASSYKYVYDDNKGDLLYEDENVKILVGELAPYEGLGFNYPTLGLYYVNKGDKHLNVCPKDVSVNGFSIQAGGYTSLPAGKRLFGGIALRTDLLKENGIDGVKDIHEMEFSICISDWFSGEVYAEPEPFKLTFGK